MQEAAGERRGGRAAGHGDLSLRETLALLCRTEVAYREERRIQMGTGIAKFPHQRTLEGFDFAAQPSLDARQVRDLAACRWVANGDALLIQGPPGVGKTHLAIALGREAIRHGYSVLFAPDDDQKIEPPLSGLDLGYVDVEVAKRVGLELTLAGSGAFHIGQARDAVPLKTAVQ